MTHDPKPSAPRKPETLSDEELRQGRIVLRTHARRALFIGGLIAIAVFTAAMALLR